MLTVSIDESYNELCHSIIRDGVWCETRNGNAQSLFGEQIRHYMQDGFPLLSGKKMAFKQIVAELTWFLKGRTDIEYLHERNCHIWDGDYEKHGSLGPIYGKQWRDWDGIDQIKRLIHMLKNEPESRRMFVSAWNVDDLHAMAVPPCHHSFQVWTRDFGGDKRGISLMWNQRSVDVPLGLPFNIASYGLLLLILAREVDMEPEWLVGSLGDCHIYQNQMKGMREQLGRDDIFMPCSVEFDHKPFDQYDVDDFKLVGYDSHPAIKFPLNT